MSNEYSSHGITLSIGDGAEPEVYTAIGTLGNMQGLGSESSTAEIPDHGDKWRRYRPGGKLEPGSLQATLSWDPGDSGQAALRTAQATGRVPSFQVLMPAEVVVDNLCTFSAVVQTLGDITMDQDGLLSQQIVLKLSGEPVWSTAP